MLDSSLLGEGILHYLAHVRGTFAKTDATLIPAAAVVKGMLVQLRSGEAAPNKRHVMKLTTAVWGREESSRSTRMVSLCQREVEHDAKATLG